MIQPATTLGTDRQVTTTAGNAPPTTLDTESPNTARGVATESGNISIEVDQKKKIAIRRFVL